MIKSCVIGLSTIGQIHCESLLKLKKTSLSYVFDKNYKLSRKISKKFKCKTSNNFNIILKKKDIDLFVIASPTSTHDFYIMKLIKSKKIIYCEKPITMNNKNLDKIKRLIKRNKIRFGVGLNRRFAKEYISLKHKIKKKKVETIQIISKSANHNLNLSIRNGGLFFDKGYHFFDLACWLSNSLPKRIIVISKSISKDNFLNKGDFSDAIINMKFKNGTNVEFLFSRKCAVGNIEVIKIYGKGFFYNSDNYAVKKNLSMDFSIRHKESYLKCLKEFLEKKRPFLLNQSLIAQKICAKVLKKAVVE